MGFWEDVNAIPILEVAELLDITIVQDKGSYAMALCPFHEDHLGAGGHPNLSLMKVINKFKCHHGECGAHGSVIDLYAKAAGVEPQKALTALGEKFGIQDPGKDWKPPQAKQATQKAPKKELKKKPKVKEKWDVNRVMKAHHALMSAQNEDHLQHFLAKRKVTKEYVLEKKIGLDMIWGIDTDNQKDLAYTIPAFDEDGEIIAIRTHSRLVRKNKRFIPGSSSKVFYDLTSYNKDADEIHICEGEGDLWTLEHGLGRNALTSLSGAGALPEVFQKDLSVLGDLEKKKRIVLYPDNDKSGDHCMARIRFYLPKKCPVHILKWPPAYKGKQDISFWLNEQGRTEEELEALIKEYPWKEAEELLQEIAAEKDAKAAYQAEGLNVLEDKNRYIRMIPLKKGGEKGVDDRKIISNFVIRGKATMEVEGQAYTKCDILTPMGEIENDKQIPPETWLGKRDFLKAFMHTKYEFIGNENDIQNIKRLVTKTIKKGEVRKGVPYIGFEDGYFVGPGFIISKDGILKDAPVEYVKQGLPLEEALTIVDVPDVKQTLQDFSDIILRVNKPRVIVPVLGWLFACLFKEEVRKKIQYFPLMSVFGTSGAGKTTFIQTMLRMLGIKKNSHLMNANASAFTAMRMLSCTNCLPLAVDELKEDAGKEMIDFWKRHARSAYGGEIETRGRQDLTLKSYAYKAPLLILGETSILREKATIERTISVEPRVADHSKETRDAFSQLRDLNLESLFPHAVKWILSNEPGQVSGMWQASKQSLMNCRLPFMPPRVWDNYVTMIFGIEAFEAFCKSHGVDFTVPLKVREEAVSQMIGEVLTVAKRTKVGFDELIEAMSIMANEAIIKKDQHYAHNGEWLYFHLPTIVALFRKWARDTRYDGDVLGKKEYRNQAREIEKMSSGRYVFSTNKVWKINEKATRCIQVSLRRAERSGLEVSGLGFTEEKAPEEWETPAEDTNTEQELPPLPEIPRELTETTPEPPPPEEEEDIFGDM